MRPGQSSCVHKAQVPEWYTGIPVLSLVHRVTIDVLHGCCGLCFCVCMCAYMRVRARVRVYAHDVCVYVAHRILH